MGSCLTAAAGWSSEQVGSIMQEQELSPDPVLLVVALDLRPAGPGSRGRPRQVNDQLHTGGGLGRTNWGSELVQLRSFVKVLEEWEGPERGRLE